VQQLICGKTLKQLPDRATKKQLLLARDDFYLPQASGEALRYIT
jgi:hypothetical protein